MKTLAFSLTLTLLIAETCWGAAVPESGQGGTGEATEGGTSGTQIGQPVPPGPCGTIGWAVPTNMFDCSNTEYCSDPLRCGSDGNTCCLAFDTLQDACNADQRARPVDPATGCSAVNCEEGTCSTKTLKGMDVPICCTESTLHDPPTSGYECDAATSCSVDSDCSDIESSMKGGICHKEKKQCCLQWMTSTSDTPDMSMCSDTNTLLTTVVEKNSKCLIPFAAVTSSKSLDEFCRIFWDGIDCFAEDFFPENELHQQVCLNMLKRYIHQEAKSILQVVINYVKTVDPEGDVSGLENYDPRDCPGIYDGSASGTGGLACSYGDMTFQQGDRFPDREACNICVCEGNSSACTEMACLPNGGVGCELITGDSVSSGKWTKHEDGCNRCFCYDGRLKCTDLARCRRQEMPRCPALSLMTTDECNNEEKCGAEKPCDIGSHCCASACGSGTECKPDLGICSDVDSMLGFLDADQTKGCVVIFNQIASTEQTSDDFCRSFYDGIVCLRTALAQGNEEIGSSCQQRIIYYLTQQGREALNRIVSKVTSGSVTEVSHNPAECPVVKELVSTDTDMDENAPTDHMGRPVDTRQPQPALGTGLAANCGDITMVTEKVQECKAHLSAVKANTPLKAKCQNMRVFMNCVTGKLSQGRDAEAMKCLADVKQVIVRHKNTLIERVPNMAHLKVQQCDDMENVCGMGIKPLDSQCDADGDCGEGYECRKQFCCPIEREGKCPAVKGIPTCAESEKCEKDKDCDDDDKKCCDAGCGYKTCIQLETEGESKCNAQFNKAVAKLAQLGVCGDGKSLIEIPKCQGTKFAPVQGDFRNSQLYCVKEDGSKVKGSDFEGNKNCIKEREGRCPMPPEKCRGENAGMVGTCRNDGDCPTGTHKCCVSELDNGSCGKMCITPDPVPENDVVTIPACPNNEERSCCPVTFNVGRRCPAHPGAIPRVMPCGGCKTEWFDKNGNKVDCHEGMSMCRQKQAQAMEKNRRMLSESDQLALFIKHLKDQQRMPEMKEKDEYDDDARSVSELEVDENDYGDWTEEKLAKYMKWIAEKLCAFMKNNGVCQNGGSCALMMTDRRPYQLCSCPAGFGGLFCEKASKPAPCNTVQCIANPCDVTTCPKYPSAQCQANYCGGCNAQFIHTDGSDVTFDCSDCRTNKLLADTTLELLRGYGPKSVRMHKFLTLMPPKHMAIPMLNCSASGKYEEIQRMLMIPVMKDATVFKMCVDPETGERIQNTPIVFEESNQLLDCSVRQAIDAALLHPKCWLKKYADCQDVSKCHWYYNADSRKCEQGEAGWGFSTLNQCYDLCRPMTQEDQCPPVPSGTMGICAEMCPEEGCPAGQACCSNGCGHVCKDIVSTAPLPCADRECDYMTQYCHVTRNVDTGAHEGECKDFQEHCLMPKDEGYGKAMIGAYYFDAAKRTCKKFKYGGMGGNKNRFYELHQCRTECAMREYRFSEPACPVPKMLAQKDMTSIDMCDKDTVCPNEGVCCSDGKHRVCSMPVRSCLDGHRCPFYGYCDGTGMCQCPTCEGNTDTQKVCGSDGVTYDNECKLQMSACSEKKRIYVKSTGACPTNPVMATSQECADGWACTLEYMPLCVLDQTDPTNRTTRSYSNPCAMAGDKKCKSRDLVKLYDGECKERPCPQCQIYHTACVNNECTCNSVCTDEYMPVCGHPAGLHDQTQLFSNLCEMQQYGCEKGEIFVVARTPDACEKVEETEDDLLECPKLSETMAMMVGPGMDAVNCDLAGNNYCDPEMERCCQIGEGEGTQCVPKEKLMRKRVERQGIPQILSVANFLKKDCRPRHCKDNGDCKGDGICVENFVCGHNTCAPPIVKPNSPNVCPADHFMIPKMLCNPMDRKGCPNDLEGTLVTRGHYTMCVCCAETKDRALYTEEVVFKANLGQQLMHLGLMCENGGTFDPSLENAQICNCAGTGHTGAFCTDALGTMDTKCTRQKAFASKLSDVLSTLVATAAQNQASDEETMETSNGGMQGTGSGNAGNGRGNGQGNAGGNAGGNSNSDMETSDDTDMGEMTDEDEMMAYIEAIIQEEQRGVGLIKLLAGKGLKYLLMDVQCDASGNFEAAQCGVVLGKPHKKGCFCIDKANWMTHLPGPMADTRDNVDCNMINSEIPKFCYDRPQTGATESLSGRYFFNPDTADCEEFQADQWCDPNGNNFPSYETCRSVCSSTSWTPRPCWAVRCPSGTACRVKMGVAECKDVTEPMEIASHFEPKCAENGKFEPKQCSSTSCVCVNPDTGEPIPGAIGAAVHLKCQLDSTQQHGVRVTNPEEGQGFRCENTDPKFCPEGGHPCHNCTPTYAEMQGEQQGQNQGNMGQGQGQSQGQGSQGQGQSQTLENLYGGLKAQETDERGYCRNCGTCPAGQGQQVCSATCTGDQVCKQYPEAECVVDRCTCQKKWIKADGTTVGNCNAVQGNCVKKQDETIRKVLKKQQDNAQKKIAGETVEDTPYTILHCTAGGSYESECAVATDGSISCFCLHASSGKPTHESAHVVQGIDQKPDCSAVQTKTKAKKASGKMKIADGRLADWSEAKKEKVKEAGCKAVERKAPVTCLNPRLEEGSIIFVYDMEANPISTIQTDTDDLASIAATIQAEVNQGEFLFEVDGETYVASDGVVTALLTAEDLGQGPTTVKIEPEDDKKTVIIVVVVVVVVVVLILIIAAACYCVRKKKSGKQEMPFDDLAHGKNNPAYEKNPY